MEGFRLVDVYSTKGIEYLIVAVFFFGFLRKGSRGSWAATNGWTWRRRIC